LADCGILLARARESRGSGTRYASTSGSPVRSGMPKSSASRSISRCPKEHISRTSAATRGGSSAAPAAHSAARSPKAYRRASVINTSRAVSTRSLCHDEAPQSRPNPVIK
jgi:hypothetical protein